MHFQFRPATGHPVDTSLAEEHYQTISTVRYCQAYELGSTMLQRYVTAVPALDRIYEEGYVLDHFPAIDHSEPESPFPPYAQGGRRPIVQASSKIPNPTSETGVFAYRKGMRGARSTLGTAEVRSNTGNEASELSDEADKPINANSATTWAAQVAALEKEWFGNEDDDDDGWTYRRKSIPAGSIAVFPEESQPEAAASFVEASSLSGTEEPDIEDSSDAMNSCPENEDTDGSPSTSPGEVLLYVGLYEGLHQKDDIPSADNSSPHRPEARRLQ